VVARTLHRVDLAGTYLLAEGNVLKISAYTKISQHPNCDFFSQTCKKMSMKEVGIIIVGINMYNCK
jgi:hypothetical protein